MGPELAIYLAKPVSEHLDILYAAHTVSCTFLLDADGICRRIVPVLPATTKASKRRDTVRAASRCVGAQYVASLDANVAGMLAEMPRVGAPMLFARTDERGRISLVRTGNVTRFESHRHDPFAANEKESLGILTSAPKIAPSEPAPRLVREAERAAVDEELSEDVDFGEAEVPPARNSGLRTLDSDTFNKTAEYETPTRHQWAAEPLPAPPRMPTILPAPSHDDAFHANTTLTRAPRREIIPPPMPPRPATPRAKEALPKIAIRR
jgi:hypothetical protein